MSFTNRGNGGGRHAAPDQGTAPGTVTSIPLSDVDNIVPGQGSIGDLVKDATTQVSTLVRAEVELAKAEVTGEIKKGVQGGIFFILALTVLLFSSFFFFFFLAELLDQWVARWLAFLIVFLAMVVITALFAFIGYLRVRKLRAPAKTIESLKATSSLLTPAKAETPAQQLPGKHAAGALNG